MEANFYGQTAGNGYNTPMLELTQRSGSVRGTGPMLHVKRLSSEGWLSPQPMAQQRHVERTSQSRGRAYPPSPPADGDAARRDSKAAQVQVGRPSRVVT